MTDRRRHKKKKKKQAQESNSATVDLNLMPFIDIFSLLTTFLLFSAVFVHIGVLEVQVPFLTNAPPPPSKPQRTISVKVDVSDTQIEVISEFSEPPINQQKATFDHTETGIGEMHKKLVETRQSSPDNDKLTLFVDDDVTYDRLTKVIDAIKILNPGEPPFPTAAADPEEENEEDALKKKAEADDTALYPKIVMGSVML